MTWLLTDIYENNGCNSNTWFTDKFANIDTSEETGHKADPGTDDTGSSNNLRLNCMVLMTADLSDYTVISLIQSDFEISTFDKDFGKKKVDFLKKTIKCQETCCPKCLCQGQREIHL